MRSIAAYASAALLALGWGQAHAQVPEIRLARQYSMGYLQFNVMDHRQLIQKHAARLGIPEVKVTWVRFNGPSTMNDALISDSIDIVAGSPSGMLTIWNRTRGTAQEVRAITALASLPFKLNTNDPTIRGVDDLGRCGKIAVPSIKVSSPAMTLQMAAAKAYGAKEYARYDPLTVAMSPPDATIALLTGRGGVNCAFGLPPFLQQQLQSPDIHSALDSFEVAGGPNTYTLSYTSKRFRDRAPVLFQALYAALGEATEMVNADPRQASQYWIEDGNSKLTLDFVTAAATEKQVRWTTVPERTMLWADFMHSVGTLKTKPASWKEYFWPDADSMDGS